MAESDSHNPAISPLGPPRESLIDLSTPPQVDADIEEEKTSLGTVLVFNDDRNDDDPMTFDSIVDGLGHAWNGREFAGRFRIESLVDRGDRCLVFRAHQHALERPIAIKVIRSHLAPHRFASYKEAFVREARATSKLSHPNIAAIHDHGETEEGEVWVAMELLLGRNLRRLQRDGPLSAGRSITLFEGVARALRHAHSNGVLHLDLKPSNVFLVPSQSGENPVRVMGFGDVRGHGRQHQPFTETPDENDLGASPLYAAPEQIRGHQADHRADYYALGVLMFQTLTGRLPFEGPTPMAAALRRLKEPIPSMSSVNPEVRVPRVLEFIARRCMMADPDDRYDTADELLTELEEARRTLFSSGAPTTGEVPRPQTAEIPRTETAEIPGGTMETEERPPEPGPVETDTAVASDTDEAPRPPGAALKQQDPRVLIAIGALALLFVAGAAGLGIGIVGAAVAAFWGDGDAPAEQAAVQSVVPHGTFMGKADGQPIVLTVRMRDHALAADLLLRGDDGDRSMQLVGSEAPDGSFQLSGTDFSMVGEVGQEQLSGTFEDGARTGEWYVNLD